MRFLQVIVKKGVVTLTRENPKSYNSAFDSGEYGRLFNARFQATGPLS